MFDFLRGWFGRQQAPLAHVHQRELAGLVACLVAWHRGALEDEADQGGDIAHLEERRSALAWFAHGAGVTDPFALHVLQIPVWQLERDLFLLASYRIETAGGLAWALELLDALPPSAQRVDVQRVAALFPLEGAPPAEIDTAALRDSEQRERAMLALRDVLARPVAPGDVEANLSRSRAYERARALCWVDAAHTVTLDAVDPLVALGLEA